jgi:hypothetical protein
MRNLVALSTLPAVWIGFRSDQIARSLGTTRRPVENPVERVLREGIVVGLANHTVLIARDATERSIVEDRRRTAEAGLIIIL